MIGLTMHLFGGIWTLELWVWKAANASKHCLMCHTSRNIEDSGTKSYNYGGLIQEVSEQKMFDMLPKDYSCDILVKKVAEKSA